MRPIGQSCFITALVGAGFVSKAATEWTLDVSCPSQQPATLTIAELTASYLCSDGTRKEAQMGNGYFMVDVNVETLALELKGSSVEILNFSSSATIKPVLSPGKLDFRYFSHLKSLIFTHVVMDSVELMTQNVTTDVRIINSDIEDLSLPLPGEALTQIDLSGTSVAKLPTFLYERDLHSNVNVMVDLSLVHGEAELSSKQLSILEANLQTLSAQSWARDYASSCEMPEILSATVPSGSTERTVVCGTGSSSPSMVPASGHSSISSSDNVSDGSTAGVSSGDSTSSISTGALVATIVVVVVFAVLLTLFLLRMYVRRKAANASSPSNDAATTLMSKREAANKSSFISNDEFLRNFRLPQSDVALVKSVGTGRLWMGEYHGGKVVLKRVESEVTDSYVTKALMAQARMLAVISHPNITNLVGVTWLAGTDFAVVTEFMDKGNLKTMLANTDVDLTVATKLQMCSDVALALAYVHESERNMCARQLSSRKVLVNKAMSCKLSLFECVPISAKLGCSNVVAAYSYGMGELAWLPPEVITRSCPTEARKSNIYAFGVLVSEIFSRVSPYQSLVEKMGNTMSDIEIAKRVRRRELLAPHENRHEYLAAPASVRQLVERCLSYAPMSRPTAKDIMEVLHGAKNELLTKSV